MPNTTDPDAPGLRERKKLRTREAIVRAAFELVDEVGYEGATIARIAERADVSPRTIHTTFAGKDEILLAHAEEVVERLQGFLDEPDGRLVERVMRWVQAEAVRVKEHVGLDHLRDRAFATDPHLQSLEYALRRKLEGTLARAAARDLGETGELPSLTAQAFGGATTGVLMAIRDRAAAGVEVTLEEFTQALGVIGTARPPAQD